MPRSSPPPPRTWWRSRVASFGFAFAGARDLLSTQPHARIHAAATVAVAGAGVGFGVSPTEAALLALAVGLVWATEALNTALEALVDLVHPEWARPAGRVKDLAAGAVLFAAAGAASAGGMVFGPYVLALLR